MYYRNKKLLFILTILYSTSPLLSVGLKKDTPVYTERGRVAIEDIKIGDRVISYNFDRQEPESDSVVSLFKINNAKKVMSLTALSALTVAAYDHKIFSYSKKAWTKAEDLELDDTLQTLSGVPVELESLTSEQQKCILHCLTMKKNHNFYVSDKDILVHNFVPLLVFTIPIAATVAEAFAAGTITVGGLVCGKLVYDHAAEKYRKEQIFRKMDEERKKNPDKQHNSAIGNTQSDVGTQDTGRTWSWGWASQPYNNNQKNSTQFEKDRESAKRDKDSVADKKENAQASLKPDPSITERSFDKGYVKRIHGGYEIKTDDDRKIIRKTANCRAGNEHVRSEVEILPHDKGVIEKTDVDDKNGTIIFNTVKEYTVEEWNKKVQSEEQERKEKRGYLGGLGYIFGIGQEARKWKQDEFNRRSTLPYHATQLSERDGGVFNSFKSAVGLPVPHKINISSFFEELPNSGALVNSKKGDKKPNAVTPNPGKTKPAEDDAQAPGNPAGKHPDYEAPKKWDGKKKKMEGGPLKGKTGYPAKDGRIWVPTGNGGMAHGGPHWDVAYPDGKGHGNKRPTLELEHGQKCEALKDNVKSYSSNRQRSTSPAAAIISGFESGKFTSAEVKTEAPVRDDNARHAVRGKTRTNISPSEQSLPNGNSKRVSNISEENHAHLKTMAASIDKETRERMLNQLREKRNEKKQ